METDDLAPKEDTVKCLTAKVLIFLFRKSRCLSNLSSRLIRTSTIQLRHLLNLDFQELDATVVIITGENHRKQQIVVMQST